MYIVASAPGIRETFPNISVALRIYLCMLVTNCSDERSFSVLSWVKHKIRATMSHELNVSILSFIITPRRQHIHHAVRKHTEN